MAVPLLQVDAFADAPFRGNPAAVCLLDGARDAEWMQHVAAEMNLPETAFLIASGPARFGLRWFTPATEVALCGHATLASAHALWTLGRVPAGEAITFDTLSGPLVARPGEGGRGDAASITIELPARQVDAAPLPEAVAAALNVSPRWTGVSGKHPDLVDYLVVLDSESDVRAARPDMVALRSIPCGVILTAPAGGRAKGAADQDAAERGDADIASRYFVPYFGIDEDPVTGAAHCALATYWAAELGRPTLVARQVSAREGLLGVRLDGDRVHLTGRAVTILRGELVV